MKKNSFEDFREALGFRESSSNYQAENRIGYIGKYQLGEAMMHDLGYYKPKFDGTYKLDWIGEWTGKQGINSKEDFLNNPGVQESAFEEEMEKLNDRIKKFGLEKYINTIYNGKYITRSGMLAAAHLKGVGGLKKFFETGKDSTDGFGTQISSYLINFSGYRTPYIKPLKPLPNGKYEHESLYFTWITGSDEVCSSCGILEGRVFKYGVDIEPPLHPHCYCSIQDYFSEDNKDNISQETKYVSIQKDKVVSDLYSKKMHSYIQHGAEFSVDDLYSYLLLKQQDEQLFGNPNT